MSRWTLRQIDQVSGIRAQSAVAFEMIARAYVDVLAMTRQRLVQSVVSHAHAFAVEVHPGDVRFGDIEDDRGVVTVTAWWQPEADVVEFAGGPWDGRLLSVHRPGEPVVAWEPPADWANEALVEPSPLQGRRVVYKLTGWHETERHWTYEATS